MNIFLKNTRNYSLDILRILAGLLVVAIHISDPFLYYQPIIGGLSWWIANIVNITGRIAVPLFVMISGALLLPKYNKYSTEQFLKKRLLRILPPLIVWSLFYLYTRHPALFNFQFVLNAFLSSKLEHLYFLVIMIGLYIITPPLWVFWKSASSESKRYILYLTAGFSILLFITNQFVPYISYVPNSFTICYPYIFFYLAGAYLVDIKFKKRSFILSLFAIFIFIIISAIVKYAFIHNSFSSYISEPFSIFILPLTVLTFLVINNLDITSLLKRKYVSHYVVIISKTIFGIFLIHPLLIQFLDNNLNMKVESLTSPLFVFMLIKIIGVFVCSAVLIFILSKIPVIKYIVGGEE
jgi:surface polysaccharide O-acyltransferase-like enzyme